MPETFEKSLYHSTLEGDLTFIENFKGKNSNSEQPVARQRFKILTSRRFPVILLLFALIFSSLFWTISSYRMYKTARVEARAKAESEYTAERYRQQKQAEEQLAAIKDLDEQLAARQKQLTELQAKNVEVAKPAQPIYIPAAIPQNKQAQYANIRAGLMENIDQIKQLVYKEMYENGYFQDNIFKAGDLNKRVQSLNNIKIILLRTFRQLDAVEKEFGIEVARNLITEIVWVIENSGANKQVFEYYRYCEGRSNCNLYWVTVNLTSPFDAILNAAVQIYDVKNILEKGYQYSGYVFREL